MTTRGPVFHRIPARFAAQVDYVVNLNLVLHFPNPTRPWAQYDWPRTTDLPKLKAVGEPIGRVNPVLTPNPTRPWSQYDWPSAARIPLSLKSDSYWGGSPLYYPNPPQPFRQNLWEGERPLPKAIGEAIGGDAPLLTPNPAQPFTQADWFSIRSTLKAKVDDFVNLLPYQIVVPVSPPFYQNLWDNPARIRLTATGEINNSIFVVTAPFQQTEWIQPPPGQKIKFDDVSLAALRPLYSPNPPQPFSQNDWPLSRPPVRSDTGFGFGFNPNLPPPTVILWAQSVT